MRKGEMGTAAHRMGVASRDFNPCFRGFGGNVKNFHPVVVKRPQENVSSPEATGVGVFSQFHQSCRSGASGSVMILYGFSAHRFLRDTKKVKKVKKVEKPRSDDSKVAS
jgi:hypothetical protein